MRTVAAIGFVLATLVSSAALAQPPMFETALNAWADYAPEYCEGQAAFNMDWDPDIAVWVVKFVLKEDGASIDGVYPEACAGGLPEGWISSVQEDYPLESYNLYYYRAPFDYITGRYYNLIPPYGHWLVATDAGNNGGWCIIDDPALADWLCSIEIGGYTNEGAGGIVASTSANGGITLDAPCASANKNELEKLGVAPATWARVKGLYQ